MSLDIHWQWLAFDALTRDQLYELLRLRSAVFVVEQNCVFQDIDGLDDKAMHLLGVRAAVGSVYQNQTMHALGVRVAAGSAPCPPPALRAPPLPTQNPLPPELLSNRVGEPTSGFPATASATSLGLVAYARCFPAGVKFDEASIGRVVTKPDARGGGLGHELMAEAIQALQAQWGRQPIRIGAQAHLQAFYERHGFVDVGKPYLEDDIPHLEMLRNA